MTQSLFDTSIYVNTVLDVVILKNILFHDDQRKLFDSILVDFEGLKQYLKNISNYEHIMDQSKIK